MPRRTNRSIAAEMRAAKLEATELQRAAEEGAAILSKRCKHNVALNLDHCQLCENPIALTDAEFSEVHRALVGLRHFVELLQGPVLGHGLITEQLPILNVTRDGARAEAILQCAMTRTVTRKKG